MAPPLLSRLASVAEYVALPGAILVAYFTTRGTPPAKEGGRLNSQTSRGWCPLADFFGTHATDVKGKDSMFLRPETEVAAKN